MCRVRIHTPKNRRHEMTYRPWPMRIGNVDGPEAGIFPCAEDDISLDHAIDVMNPKASARPIRRAKSIKWKPEGRDLDRILFIAHIEDVHVTERTLFSRSNLVCSNNNIRSPAVGRNNDTHAVGVALLRGRPFDLTDHRRLS